MCLAIPGQIVELVEGQSHQALVEVSGVRRRVDMGLLIDDPPVVGEWVLIHVGFAMSRIGAEQADEQMRMLHALGEAEAAMTEVRGYGLDDALPDGVA